MSVQKHDGLAGPADHAALLEQMREANEKLVIATLRADDLLAAASADKQAIAESEERFRIIVTTSSAVVFRADAEGRVRVDPKGWCGFIGVAENDLSSDDGCWLSFVHPPDQQAARDAWARAISSGRRYERQHRLRRADGSSVVVVVCAERIPKTGPLREWFGTITDISDRIRIEEAREQFIAILGHDLRGPLGAITMGTELLKRGELPEAQRDVVVRIARGALRMDRMISSLLDFARGRLGGGIPIERAPCDLAALCDEAVAEARQAHPSREILTTTSGDTKGEWDRDRIEQVLSNLLANAVRHGSDPIEIAVHAEELVSVVLSVHNHGVTIPDDVLPVLFEPYRGRAPGATKGLGLGLYIVREIVRAHGGAISVRSSDGHGTTFTIVLPRFAPAPAAGASVGEGDDRP